MADKTVAQTGSETIAELAERQHGVVSAAQLRSLGLSRDQLGARVRSGWLHRLHRGVYSVGHRRLTQRGTWMAAVLACGEGAVLSHRAAACLWGIVPSPKATTGSPVDGPIDVTVPVRGGRSPRPGLVIHRAPDLAAADTSSRDGIPLTSAERTLVDLGVAMGRRGLERAVDEAHRLRLTNADRLQHQLRRDPRRRGTGPLRAVLNAHAIGSTATRSELEERFLALCRARGLPPPGVNVSLHGFTVDFLWQPARLVVEVDGRQSHGTPAAFQRDRDRDTSLAAVGFTTLRFTWWDVTRRPAVVAHRIRRVLDRPAAE